MDAPIIPPAIHRARGAWAFDQGLGIDDHNMRPGAPAIADWQDGYRERQAEVAAERVLAAAMAMGCPP